jgi:predicted Zn-dependent protease
VIAFAGVLHDGRTTLSVPVRLEANEDAIVIADGTATARLPRAGIHADAPIPGVPRTLRLPGGETIETADHAAVAALWPERGFVSRVAFALESRWWAPLTGIAVTAACAWLIVAVVLPYGAEPVARRIGPNVERYLGEQALASLDRTFLKPSRLPEEAQDEWGDKFEAFIAGERGEERFDLVFRHAGAPNAFALPGGTIVVTDEMVEVAKGDDEMYAVLAHEIGHVRGRHSMRLVLQDSGLAVLVTALAGDAVGVTILAAALPSILLQSRYSREFETEADDYALAHLERHGVPPRAFADLMRRLATEEKAAAGNDATVLRYLGSHPATEERIRRAEEAR